MKIRLRILQDLLSDIHRDLSRPHDIAYERVGFVSCSVGSSDSSTMILVAGTYHPVADDDYLDDPSAGAVIGRSAFRKALQIAYSTPVGMFHIHRHEHRGTPWFSSIDLRESAKFVPDFWNVRPNMPHGALVLSKNSASGLCWYPGRAQPIKISEFWAIGTPTEHL